MPRTFEGQAQPAELHDKATPQLKRHRLASHMSAFQRCLFSKDKVCKLLTDPVGPPGDGSRPQAMSVPSFQTGQGKYSIFWRLEAKKSTIHFARILKAEFSWRVKAGNSALILDLWFCGYE